MLVLERLSVSKLTSFSNLSGSELIFQPAKLSVVRVLILKMISIASSWFRLSQLAMFRSVNASSPNPWVAESKLLILEIEDSGEGSR